MVKPKTVMWIIIILLLVFAPAVVNKLIFALTDAALSSIPRG